MMEPLKWDSRGVWDVMGIWGVKGIYGLMGEMEASPAQEY